MVSTLDRHTRYFAERKIEKETEVFIVAILDQSLKTIEDYGRQLLCVGGDRRVIRELVPCWGMYRAYSEGV